MVHTRQGEKAHTGAQLNVSSPFRIKARDHRQLQIKGQDTRDLNIFELSKLVGTVLQDSDGQFVGLTAGEDIAFALENDCVKHAVMHERVQKVAEMVDMDALLTSSPFELSGGQKQRTSLAGVMIDDVDILLFDEPLANLEPATGKKAIEIIDDIHCTSPKKRSSSSNTAWNDVLHRNCHPHYIVLG